MAHDADGDERKQQRDADVERAEGGHEDAVERRETGRKHRRLLPDEARLGIKRNRLKETVSDQRTCVAAPTTMAAASVHAAERMSRVRVTTPGRNQIQASPPKPMAAAKRPSAVPAENRPCSKPRSACVKESRAIQSNTPGRPATVKSSTQEPMVKASVTIAAVAALSAMAAANSATEPTSNP